MQTVKHAVFPHIGGHWEKDHLSFLLLATLQSPEWLVGPVWEKAHYFGSH